MKFESADEVIKYIHDEDIQFLDVRFTDVPGTEHHLTIPAEFLSESVLEEGLAFDGSSIRGFATIDQSDMSLLPDLSHAEIDVFRKAKTLNMHFFVIDPLTREPFSRDPRNVARKAEEYLTSTGIADTCYVGAEAEFYVFDSVAFHAGVNHSFYKVDASEGWWNRGRETELDGGPNLGHKNRRAGGYFPTAPYDHTVDMRDDMARNLADAGFTLDRLHHEVGPGQHEINYKYDSLLRSADNLQTFKYIIKNTARNWGKSATFMPKPLLNEAGSGMHAHMSLWANGEPLFNDEAGYAGLSDTARYFIGGVLEHAPAVLAFTNPTLNSYHRLVKGFEAPINLVYSQRNRSAAVRIPITGSNPKAKRIEFRAPDPSANPYFAFSAIMLAGLDGVKNRIEPHAPVDKDLYELPPEESASIPTAPTSLEESLAALETDSDFLTDGDVFTEDLIEAYVRHKWDNEITPSRLGPTPLEYELYYDC